MAARPSRPAAPKARSVGKAELASLLGWSRPRLDRRLLTDPSFPVVRRGDQAGGWGFDPAAVQAYLGGEEPAPPAAPVASPPPAIDQAQLRAAVAPPAAKPVAAPGQPLRRSAHHEGEATARQRKGVAQANLLEDKLALERGELLLRDDVERAATDLCATMRQQIDAMPERLVKECDLPEQAAGHPKSDGRHPHRDASRRPTVVSGMNAFAPSYEKGRSGIPILDLRSDHFTTARIDALDYLTGIMLGLHNPEAARPCRVHLERDILTGEPDISPLLAKIYLRGLQIGAMLIEMTDIAMPRKSFKEVKAKYEKQSRGTTDNIVLPTYRPTAHLWAAHLAMSGMRSFPCAPENLELFIAYAETLRKNGEGLKIRQSRYYMLRVEETWKLPVELSDLAYSKWRTV